jgi:hypothetical protein
MRLLAFNLLPIQGFHCLPHSDIYPMQIVIVRLMFHHSLLGYVLLA